MNFRQISFSETHCCCHSKSSSLDRGLSLDKSRAGAAFSRTCLNSSSTLSWELAISRSVRWGSSVSQYTIMTDLWVFSEPILSPRGFPVSSWTLRTLLGVLPSPIPTLPCSLRDHLGQAGWAKQKQLLPFVYLPFSLFSTAIDTVSSYLSC